MKTSEIKQQVWALTEKLRGKMDANDFKDYLLPLMLYKELAVLDVAWAFPEYPWQTTVDNCKQGTMKLKDWEQMIADFDEQAQKRENEQDLTGVFSDMNLASKKLGKSEAERENLLNEIVVALSELEFKDDQDNDVLGDVYEFLLAKFSTTAGKGGEFYTPQQVSRVVAQIATAGIDSDKTLNAYDPTMGSGSLLLGVAKEITNPVIFHGQEMNPTTYNLARINVLTRGIPLKDIDLYNGDTLEDDYLDNRKMDVIVANPPYSVKWKDKSHADDPRFKDYALAPASKGDYAFILHSLYHLADHGQMAVVLPHGVLFRGAKEGKIRQQLIEENLLDAVIGLPANIFASTQIPTAILVFKKNRERTDVLFIDASKGFEKDKKQNRLRDEDVQKIVDTYAKRQDVDKYAHVATLDEIKENDYNLNIPRYVDTFEPEPVKSLGTIMDDLESIYQETQKQNAALMKMIGELTVTDDDPEVAADLDRMKRDLSKLLGGNTWERQ